MIALVAYWLALADPPPLPRPPPLDDARGVTGPEPAPPMPTPLWRDERAWAVGIVIIAVTTALIVGRRRPVPPAPELPPAEWAAAELDRLAAGSPDADALARVLRGYLARRYKIPAAGTTSETIAWLGGNADGHAWRSLLERCDAARFSNVGFGAAEWSAAIAEARRLTAGVLPVGEATASAANGATGEMA